MINKRRIRYCSHHQKNNLHWLGKHTLGVAISLESSSAPLISDATVLMASEWSIGLDLHMSIDPDTACLQLSRDAFALCHVPGPYGSTQAHIGIVGTLDHVGFVGPLQDWEHGSYDGLALLIDSSCAIGSDTYQKALRQQFSSSREGCR